jgi:hypothetical protein
LKINDSTDNDYRAFLKPDKKTTTSYGPLGLQQDFTSDTTRRDKGYLQDLRILVAIASFDFSQFPLLEEVLDSYQDVCVAGAKIDLYIHTVVPYTGKHYILFQQIGYIVTLYFEVCLFD